MLLPFSLGSLLQIITLRFLCRQPPQWHETFQAMWISHFMHFTALFQREIRISCLAQTLHFYLNHYYETSEGCDVIKNTMKQCLYFLWLWVLCCARSTSETSSEFMMLSWDRITTIAKRRKSRRNAVFMASPWRIKNRPHMHRQDAKFFVTIGMLQSSSMLTQFLYLHFHKERMWLISTVSPRARPAYSTSEIFIIHSSIWIPFSATSNQRGSALSTFAQMRCANRFPVRNERSYENFEECTRDTCLPLSRTIAVEALWSRVSWTSYFIA